MSDTRSETFARADMPAAGAGPAIPFTIAALLVQTGWHALQQPGSESLLLICCRLAGGSRNASRDGADLSCKIMWLDMANPDSSTYARGFC